MFSLVLLRADKCDGCHIFGLFLGRKRRRFGNSLDIDVVFMFIYSKDAMTIPPSFKDRVETYHPYSYKDGACNERSKTNTYWNSTIASAAYPQTPATHS